MRPAFSLVFLVLACGSAPGQGCNGGQPAPAGYGYYGGQPAPSYYSNGYGGYYANGYGSYAAPARPRFRIVVEYNRRDYAPQYRQWSAPAPRRPFVQPPAPVYYSDGYAGGYARNGYSNGYSNGNGYGGGYSNGYGGGYSNGYGEPRGYSPPIPRVTESRY